MYTVILIILLGPATFFVMNGIMKRKTGRIILGVIIGALTLFFFWFMDFWGEMLWFQSIGHEQRFWIEIECIEQVNKDEILKVKIKKHSEKQLVKNLTPIY